MARALSYQTTIQVGPVTMAVAVHPRCRACDRLLAHYLTKPFALECPRCGVLNQDGVTPALSPALASVPTVRLTNQE